MSNIIQFNEFAEASEAVNCAKELLQDQHAAIIQENQKLLSEVMALEEKNASKDLLNMNLAGQVKELQAENTILLDALVQDDDFFESKPKASVTELPKAASQLDAQYWEAEYSALKDKIRNMEAALQAKEASLKQAHIQVEQLLNELLAK